MKEKKNYLEVFSGWLIQKFHLEQYFSEHVKEDIKMLYPPVRCKEETFRYYQKKAGKTLLIFLLGLGVILLVTLQDYTTQKIRTDEQGSYVQREEIGGRTQEIPVSVEEAEQKEKFNLSVAPQVYTREEFQKICEKISKALPEAIQATNKSLEEVSSDLDLMEQYKDYPISITWSCNDYSYISSDGVIHSEELQEGEKRPVELTATLSYESFSWEEHFSVVVVPKKGTKEEEFLDRLQQFLQKEDALGAVKDKFYLPKAFQGEPLSIREEKSHKGVLLFGILLVTLVILFQMENRDLHKETEEKRERLLQEYPEFVSKLMLFMGAGMTTKSAIQRLVINYENNLLKYPKEKSDLYEELKIAVHAMNNGVYEQDAYDAFGKRTKVNQYCKLMALLTQNSKKGTKDILQLLEAEASEAFELRKQQAKRLGEQAGTKLLLPMLMMLGIVMVLIIVPAFLSYQI